MNNYDLNNCVKDPTRVAFKKIKHSSYLSLSSTLIDVVLHNSPSTIRAEIIGCPFSDHHFIACSLPIVLPTSNNNYNEYYGRSYSPKNLSKLSEALLNTDFSSVEIESDPQTKFFEFNRITNRLIDKFCPIRRSKVKDKDAYPWTNPNLLAAKIARDRLYAIWVESKSIADHENYKEARQYFQKCNRMAICEYYKTKVFLIL